MVLRHSRNFQLRRWHLIEGLEGAVNKQRKHGPGGGMQAQGFRGEKHLQYVMSPQKGQVCLWPLTISRDTSEASSPSWFLFFTSDNHSLALVRQALTPLSSWPWFLLLLFFNTNVCGHFLQTFYQATRKKSFYPYFLRLFLIIHSY